MFERATGCVREDGVAVARCRGCETVLPKHSTESRSEATSRIACGVFGRRTAPSDRAGNGRG
jgi:hypothetical protein